MITRDDLAVYIFEQCQDKTASLATIVTNVANKACVSESSIEDCIRRYKQSGTGLEEVAKQVLGNTWDDIARKKYSGVLDKFNLSITKPEPNNFAIHNGQVVTLKQTEYEFKVVDNTIQEIQDIPVSKEYFENRVKDLFPNISCPYNCLSDTKRVIERINKTGEVFDLALLDIKPTNEKHLGTNTVSYDGVLYSGYGMRTKEEIEQEKIDSQVRLEESKAKTQEEQENQERLIENLGLDKFDYPEKAYQVYCMLLEDDQDFIFNITLMSEEGDGQTFYYNEEEYVVRTEDEISDEYHEQECECIRDNPHDYVYDACTSEMIERLGHYDSDTYESDDSNYYVIKS
ncbi:MAG: hypothetical protein DRO67_04555 [Candidatus Asgardarchaeum californiense]|nr:MAG: hypothetical protein DRO67_04555 [Candidatus Asgardarchaeum californiense]